MSASYRDCFYIFAARGSQPDWIYNMDKLSFSGTSLKPVLHPMHWTLGRMSMPAQMIDRCLSLASTIKYCVSPDSLEGNCGCGVDEKNSQYTDGCFKFLNHQPVVSRQSGGGWV